MVVVIISILGFGAATKPLLAWLMGPDDHAAQHLQGGLPVRALLVELCPPTASSHCYCMGVACKPAVLRCSLQARMMPAGGRAVELGTSGAHHEYFQLKAVEQATGQYSDGECHLFA